MAITIKEAKSDKYPVVSNYCFVTEEVSDNGDITRTIYNKDKDTDQEIPPYGEEELTVGDKDEYKYCADLILSFYKYICQKNSKAADNLPKTTDLDYEISALSSYLSQYSTETSNYIVLENITKENSKRQKWFKPYWAVFKETYKTQISAYKQIGSLLEKYATYTTYNAKFLNMLSDRYKKKNKAEKLMSWINNINKQMLTAAKSNKYYIKVEKIPENIYNEIFNTNNKINLIDPNSNASGNFSRAYNANNDGARFIIRDKEEVKQKNGTSYSPKLYNCIISWVESEIKWYYCPNTVDPPSTSTGTPSAHKTNYNGGFSSSNYTTWYNYGNNKTTIDNWWNNWNAHVIAPYDLTPKSIFGENIDFPIGNTY